MNYGYLSGNSIVAPVAMMSRFKDVGGWHALTDEQRAVFDWYPCDVVGGDYDSRRQLQGFPTCTFDGERITATYIVTDKPIETIKAELQAALAAYRLTIEEGGAAIPGGGKVLTSRADQSQLNSVYSTLAAGLVTSIDWKSTGGWVSATLADVEPLARVSAIHVQSCFTAERRVSESLEAAETVDDVLAIDYKQAFKETLAALLLAAYPPAAEEAPASA